MLHDIAVLIDADNVSHQRIDWIFEQINHLGQITTKRIYGDFTKPNLSSWENAILKYAIEKKHQSSYSTGKNSSDLALAIDAIDLWHAGKYDGFCIISSDSDFIGLALRLRQGNVQVFGFGEHKAIKEFRQVCSKFFELPCTPSVHVSPKNPNTTIPTAKIPASQLKCNTKLLNALKDAINNSKMDNDGWVNYAVFSSYFQKKYPTIKSDDYGYDKFYELIDVIDIFEIKKENSTIYIRIRPTINSTNSINTQWSGEKLDKELTLINAIKESIAKNQENGWANFGTVIQYLNNHYSKLEPNTYGFKKWGLLIKKISLFETKQVNKTTLNVREKPNNSELSKAKTDNSDKINNQQLLSDILAAINENNSKDDAWIHIGYLGTQLKNKGYNPKDFGCKTFRQLLLNTDGVRHQNIKNGDYFSLSDKSWIKPATQRHLNPSDNHLMNTKLHQLLLKNKAKIDKKIKELLLRYANLNTLDFWRLLSKNLPDEFMDDVSQNHDCFVLFVRCELHELDLMAQEHGFLFCASRANTH